MKVLIKLLVIFALFNILACKRSLNKGQSSANEDPVSDNQIVLVRQGKTVGAFLLYDQTVTPENTSFKWFSRSDGKGTFLSSDPLVSSGVNLDATGITFSVFSIDWSVNTDGKGWVYFSKLPTDSKKVASFEMCVTNEFDITKIDANDRKWKYRERPSVNWKALVTP